MAEQREPFVAPRHDLSPIEIDAIEECLYNFNQVAIGRDDGPYTIPARSFAD